MVMRFRHKGLRNLFFFNETAGVMSQHVKRLRNRLTVLDAATKATDLNLPGYRLPATGYTR
jgi:proteic killer suppression protein